MLLQYLPPTAVNTTLRLQQLRAAMTPLNISAYIIPATDAHLVKSVLLSIILTFAFLTSHLSSLSIVFSFSVINLLVLMYWFNWQSEYIAPRDARLAWMSGFTGSAGVFHSQPIIILLHLSHIKSVTYLLGEKWLLSDSGLCLS